MFLVLFEDSAAMIGLAIAFLGILLGQLTGNPYFDGTASVIMHMELEFILVNVSADFVDSTPAAEVEIVIHKMDGQIKQAFPEVKRVFIEAESRVVKKN